MTVILAHSEREDLTTVGGGVEGEVAVVEGGAVEVVEEAVSEAAGDQAG